MENFRPLAGAVDTLILKLHNVIDFIVLFLHYTIVSEATISLKTSHQTIVF